MTGYPGHYAAPTLIDTAASAQGLGASPHASPGLSTRMSLDFLFDSSAQLCADEVVESRLRSEAYDLIVFYEDLVQYRPKRPLLVLGGNGGTTSYGV